MLEKKLLGSYDTTKTHTMFYRFILSLVILIGFTSTPAFATVQPDVIEDINEQPPLEVSAESEQPLQRSEVRDEFLRARVVSADIVTSEIGGQNLETQIVTVELLSGDRKGQVEQINVGGTSDLIDADRYAEGDVVIVAEVSVDQEQNYYIYDRYRIPGLAIVVGVFLVLAVVFARLRGIGSVAGLLVSITVLMTYIVPSLTGGGNPILVTLSGTLFIVSVTLFVSHGFRLRTGVALVSTMTTIGLAYLLSVFFVSVSQMFGSGTEETFYLQFVLSQSQGVDIDLRGLLLGGIIIGMLGVLDDVTMGQAASIDEIKRANPKLGFKELYTAGMSVGRDHIASLVNTLALAYVGSSLPLFLLLTINEASAPLWVLVNSEFISQEIVRTMAGSSAIILAVPITTSIAAAIFAKMKVTKEMKQMSSGHHHH